VLWNPPLRHPRQRLLHSIALLLWEPAAFDEPKILRALASELLRPVTEIAGAVAAYAPLWNRFQ